MSEPTKLQAALGLGDTNVDPDILTKEIDHDFFDDPLGGEEAEEELLLGTCQVEQGEEAMKVLNKMPNPEEDEGKTSEPNNGLLLMRLEKEDGLIEGGYHEDSGRSSSNITVHLELGSEQAGGSGEGATAATAAGPSEDFYSIQSNANYPRPKESYQLQQRRRSFGTIHQPQRSSSNASKGEQQFQPMNPTDCGLNGHFGDMTSSDSSSSGSSGDEGEESDSDLSDSSESELESLDTDDEEFVDMLEKYFDYIDPDSDCSDLTEVSPLSSLAASPLPPSFFTGMDISGGELFHSQLGGEHHSAMIHNMNVVTDELCSATQALQIGEDELSSDDNLVGDLGLSSAAEIDVAVAAVTAVASAVPVAAQLLERDLIRSSGKPRLPLVISTTETVIIPADESDDDNNAPGSMNISGGGTCSAGIDINDVDHGDYDPPPEESIGERDPAKDKKELDVCFSCCVMEHAKKILSREASPSRKHNGWLSKAKQEMEEGNGNSGGGNGNNGDEISRGGTGSRATRGTWNGKMRAGSSTSATSSSSSTTTTGSSSTNTTASGISGASSGGASGGGCLKKAQKNFTFTPEQMRKIERENHILLRKILDTHQKGYHHGHHGNHCHHHRCRNSGHHHHHNGGHNHHGHLHHPNRIVTSSTSIARLRQQKRIEHENAILMKKLQTVKPSKDIGDAFGKPVKN